MGPRGEVGGGGLHLGLNISSLAYSMKNITNLAEVISYSLITNPHWLPQQHSLDFRYTISYSEST